MKTFILEKLRSILLEEVRSNTGILIQCTTSGRYFLLKRAAGPHQGTWALLSGKMEQGDDSLGAIKREIGEEIKIDPNSIDIKFINKETNQTSGTVFYYYRGYVEKEFEATLDHENLAYGWFSKDELPQPLFPRLEQKIQQS